MHRPNPRRLPDVVLATSLLAALPGLRPAAVQTALAPGAVVTAVACVNDPTQSYALYLPPDYEGARRWPVLLVLDPRGRAEAALRVFLPAAEEFGWILVSSAGTRSDGPIEPNQRALRALWGEVPARFAIDPDRIYAAGFSGTVSVALALATSTKQVVGTIGAGANLPPAQLQSAPPLPFFGAAGRDDFNLVETQSAVDTLLRAGGRARFEPFEGRHEWLTPALAREALAWLELDAIRLGTRRRDPESREPGAGRGRARNRRAGGRRPVGRRAQARRRGRRELRAADRRHSVARTTRHPGVTPRSETRAGRRTPMGRVGGQHLRRPRRRTRGDAGL